MTERDVGLIKDTLVFGKHENDLGWMNKAKDLAKNIEKYNILSSEENSKRLIKNMSGSEDNFFDWEKKIESITDNDEKQKHIEKRELLIAGVYIAMKGKVELSESLRSASASSVDEKLPEGLKSMGRDLVVVETKDAEILNVVNQIDVMLGHDVSESDLHSYLKLQKIHLEGLRENKEVDQKCLGRVIETVEAKMEKLGEGSKEAPKTEKTESKSKEEDKTFSLEKLLKDCLDKDNSLLKIQESLKENLDGYRNNLEKIRDYNLELRQLEKFLIRNSRDGEVDSSILKLIDKEVEKLKEYANVVLEKFWKKDEQMKRVELQEKINRETDDSKKAELQEELNDFKYNKDSVLKLDWTILPDGTKISGDYRELEDTPEFQNWLKDNGLFDWWNTDTSLMNDIEREIFEKEKRTRTQMYRFINQDQREIINSKYTETKVMKSLQDFRDAEHDYIKYAEGLLAVFMPEFMHDMPPDGYLQTVGITLEKFRQQMILRCDLLNGAVGKNSVGNTAKFDEITERQYVPFYDVDRDCLCEITGDLGELIWRNEMQFWFEKSERYEKELNGVYLKKYTKEGWYEMMYHDRGSLRKRMRERTELMIKKGEGKWARYQILLTDKELSKYIDDAVNPIWNYMYVSNDYTSAEFYHDYARYYYAEKDEDGKLRYLTKEEFKKKCEEALEKNVPQKDLPKPKELKVFYDDGILRYKDPAEFERLSREYNYIKNDNNSWEGTDVFTGLRKVKDMPVAKWKMMNEYGWSMLAHYFTRYIKKLGPSTFLIRKNDISEILANGYEYHVQEGKYYCNFGRDNEKWAGQIGKWANTLLNSGRKVSENTILEAMRLFALAANYKDGDMFKAMTCFGLDDFHEVTAGKKFDWKGKRKDEQTEDEKKRELAESIKQKKQVSLAEALIEDYEFLPAERESAFGGRYFKSDSRYMVALFNAMTGASLKPGEKLTYASAESMLWDVVTLKLPKTQPFIDWNTKIPILAAIMAQIEGLEEKYSMPILAGGTSDTSYTPKVWRNIEKFVQTNLIKNVAFDVMTNIHRRLARFFGAGPRPLRIPGTVDEVLNINESTGRKRYVEERRDLNGDIYYMDLHGKMAKIAKKLRIQT